MVLWAPEVDPRHVAGLASTRTYPLRSSFRPSYNMAVNLVGTVGADTRPRPARVLVRPVPGRPLGGRPGPAGAAQRRDHASRTATRWRCHHGDFDEYFAIRSPSPTGSRRSPARAPAQRRAAAVSSLERLRIGDVIRVPPGRRAGLAVVLEPGDRRLRRAPPAGADPGPLGRPGHAGATSRPGRGARAHPGAEAFQPPLPGGPPRPGRPRSARTGLDRHGRAPGRPRQAARGDDAEIALRARDAPAPVPRLPGPGGARPLGRAAHRLERDTDALRDKVAGRTGSLARTFDQVCALLTDRGYLAARRRGHRRRAGCWPGSGRRPTCWSPSACARGVWDGLAPDELAAAVVHGALRGPPRGRRPRLGAAGRGHRRGRRDLTAVGARSRPTRPHTG